MENINTYTIKAVVDVATLAADGKVGVKVPAGFVVTGVAMKEAVKCSGGTAATATVQADNTTLGAAFDVGGASALDGFSAGTAALIASDADLKVVLGGTANVTAGTLDIAVIGVFPRGLPYADANVVTADNKAPVDPMYA